MLKTILNWSVGCATLFVLYSLTNSYFIYISISDVLVFGTKINAPLNIFWIFSFGISGFCDKPMAVILLASILKLKLQDLYAWDV